MPHLDVVLNKPAVYLNSQEGQASFTDFESLMQRIQTRSEFEVVPEVSLTSKEAKALAFIQSERKEGRSPGVRNIAQAGGFKSSRSGLRLVRSLQDKGVLSINGLVALPGDVDDYRLNISKTNERKTQRHNPRL